MEVDDPQATGVKLLWRAHGPSDEELLALKEVSGCEVREYQLSKSEYQLFIPCSKELSQDTSKIILTRLPKECSRWLVVTIPFREFGHKLGGIQEGKVAAD